MAFFKLRLHRIERRSRDAMRMDELREMRDREEREYLEYRERLGELAVAQYFRSAVPGLFTEADVEFLRGLRIEV